MRERRVSWLVWRALLPAVLAACAPATTAPPPPRDGEADVRLDVAPADAPDAPADTGARDTGGGKEDTGVPTEDTGVPIEDTGVPIEDTGVPIEDTGVPIEDTGAPAEDSGVPVEDTGVAPTDTGVAPTDTGVAPTDVPAPGPCSLPTQRALALPTDRVMATLAGASRVASVSCAATGGPEHVYPLRVAARANVRLATTAMFDTVLAVRRACDDARTEVACNDDREGTNNAALVRTLDPGDYYVLVDQYGSGGTGGAYTLDVTSVAPAANGDCARATALTPGSAVDGNSTAGGAAGTACFPEAWGPQLYYTLRVPAGQRATVTASPASAPAWRAVVRATAGCAGASCLGGGVSPGDGVPAVARVDNRGATPLDVTVAVASTTGRAGGAFSLNTALEPLSPAPAHATCASARPVAHGAALAGEDAALGTTRLASACLDRAQGTVLYYRATVPPRATLVATATPTGAWDPAVRLLAGCAATTCLAAANARGGGQPEALTYTNRGASAQEVVLAVGGVDPSGAGVFALDVAVVPPPENTTCGSALPVAPGTRLTRQNAAAGTENATGACLPAATGTVLYYRVGVPARQTLTARVTPASGMDAVARLLDGCGAAACLATANAGGAGAPEVLTFTNATDGDRRLVLAVGGLTNAANGLFDLDVGVAREYTESAVPRACDDMTGGAVVPGLAGDDVASALLDLPFPVTFYGERQLEYAVSTNGLLQLFPSLPGTASNAFDNQPIPTAAEPGRFVAALWDDLFAEAGAQVTTRVFGAAPDRRFTVQWSGYSFYNDRAARLTFQAKLFETSNAIEVHYCAITPGTNPGFATGSSATVGVEGPGGTAGRQHSHNAAMSVTTTSGIRFTP